MKQKVSFPGRPSLLEMVLAVVSVVVMVVILTALVGVVRLVQDGELPVVIIDETAVQAEEYAQYLYTAEAELPVNSVQRVLVDGQVLRACALYVADGVTYLSTDYTMLRQCGDGLE